jgi:cyclopropane-fatty-acyl-phospholipid synthase
LLPGRAAARRLADPRALIAQRLLARIRHGRLVVTTPSGERMVGQGAGGPEAQLDIHNWRALFRVLTGGDIGFGLAMVDGDCSSPDLVALLRLFDRNMRPLGAAANSAGPARWWQRLLLAWRANTREGSARNIMAHYDLGNDFFAAWLDRGMNYSSAIYAHEADTLEAAQARKLDRIVERLDLQGGERTLEIGCGWGTLAGRLVGAGVERVDALTISPAQERFAREYLHAQGRSSRARVQLKDYRDIEGAYDRIVSIEMCEAVGEAYLPLYFETIARALKQGGRAVIQAITISDLRFANYRDNADFIQRYVFPGGFLPSPSLLSQTIAGAGLKLVDAETFGISYALTLAEWRRRFHANWPRIATLGFDAHFRRLWDYYLCYCEAGFREGTIDVGLYALTRA